MIDKQLINDKNHPDYKQGIRAYTAKVWDCPICKRPNNLLFKHPSNPYKLVFACTPECVKERTGSYEEKIITHTITGNKSTKL